MLKALALITALLLAGCATTPNVIRLTDGKGADARAVREVHIDPVMLSGLPWTEDIRVGRFAVALGSFPRTAESYAEWSPLRIRYQAHAVGPDGREYPAYAMFAGFNCGTPIFFILIEGLTGPTAGVKVVILSTLLDRGYTLLGEEVAGFEPGKFQTDATYRREIIARSGTALSSVRPVPTRDFHESIVANWSVYNTKGGQIVSPLSEERVKYLAGLNPQYSYWEKVVGTARLGITLDYVGTTFGLAMDLILAHQAKTHGFDHGAVMSRREQGYNLMVLEGLRSASTCRK